MQGIGCQQAASYCTVATEGVAGGAQGTNPLIAIACLRGIPHLGNGNDNPYLIAYVYQ